MWKPPETPKVAVDAVIWNRSSIVIIQRVFPPFGFALPGGFVDVGESCEEAVVREVKEETNLDCSIINLIGVYSNPDRDKRGHIISVAYNLKVGVGHLYLDLEARDDAKHAQFISVADLCMNRLQMINDHHKILMDGIGGLK